MMLLPLLLAVGLVSVAGAKGPATKQAVAAASKLPLRMYPSQVVPALQPWDQAAAHNPLASHAIFSLNFPDQIFGFYNIASFLGSARKFHDDDIVIAVPASSPAHFLQKLAQYDVVVYLMPMTEVKGPHGVSSYYFEGQDPALAVPLAQVRYMLYQLWSLKYHRKTAILVSDFRDVFFQSNPFNYLADIWNSPGSARLAVSLEFYPNKVIESCPFNYGWIESCYGRQAAKAIARHVVSCSGVTLGARNSILVYSHLQTQHMDPAVRLRSVLTYLQSRGLTPPAQTPAELKDNDRCYSKGMDQGIHNWLLRSGELTRALGAAPTVFHQGEGPVNTIGAFQGARSKLKLDLEKIGLIMQTKNATFTVHNWDGGLSPVVHQYDRTKYVGYFEQEKVLVSASRRQFEIRGETFPFPKPHV